MPPLPTIGGEGIMFFGRPSVRCPLIPVLHDPISLLLVEGFQWNLAQIFIIWAGIAEKVLTVRGQRSRSCVQMCGFYTAEAYISTVWRWSSLVSVFPF